MDVILKKYFWVINLLVLGICAAFAGRAASHFLEAAYLTDDPNTLHRRGPYSAPAQLRQHGKEPDELVKRDIFCSGCAPPPAATPETATVPAEELNRPKKTSLQLELVSTMVCPTDDDWSVAIIK